MFLIGQVLELAVFEFHQTKYGSLLEPETGRGVVKWYVPIPYKGKRGYVLLRKERVQEKV